MKLSVVGLGKLGTCYAACFAYKGFDVTGLDKDSQRIDLINNGKSPVVETALQETINNSDGRLKGTMDYKQVMLNSDLTVILVPTPSKPDGSFSDKCILEVMERLALELRKKDKYHLFVISSTVSPGTVDQDVIPLVETISQKKLNQDFGICYNPEFIALGSVIRDILNPDIIVIGESDKKAGDILENIYTTICENKPHIVRMSIVSAEITKISLNAYLTMKISFANTLANICEKISNADVDVVTEALGFDKRVSPYFLKGGISYGGPCFPRDSRAFVAFARDNGIDAQLAKATDVVNDLQINNLVEVVLKNAKGAKTVSVLGIAYKPNTPVIEESAAVFLIEKLLAIGMEVTVYDPLAMGEAKAKFGSRISYAKTVKECIAASRLCIITIPSQEYKIIDRSYIAHNDTTVIDCWRVLKQAVLGEAVRYIALGKKNV